MKDQVQFLKSKKIDAEFFNSTQTKDEMDDIYTRVKTGDIKILYVSPGTLA